MHPMSDGGAAPHPAFRRPRSRIILLDAAKRRARSPRRSEPCALPAQGSSSVKSSRDRRTSFASSPSRAASATSYKHLGALGIVLTTTQTALHFKSPSASVYSAMTCAKRQPSASSSTSPPRRRPERPTATRPTRARLADAVPAGSDVAAGPLDVALAPRVDGRAAAVAFGARRAKRCN